MKFQIAAISTFICALAAFPASAQTPLVTEEMMVKTADPGIEIYVRNKRPANMTTFRPEQTVLYVHGATYPSETAFDLKLDGLVVDGVHRLPRLRRLAGGSTRLRQIGASAGNGRQAGGQSTDRARRDRGQGYRHRRRFHPRQAQHRAAQSAGLVVGHHADGDLHHAERGEGGAAGAVRAGLDQADGLAGAGGAGTAGCLPDGQSRAGQAALVHRRSRGQEGGSRSRRMVRCLG